MSSSVLLCWSTGVVLSCVDVCVFYRSPIAQSQVFSVFSHALLSLINLSNLDFRVFSSHSEEYEYFTTIDLNHIFVLEILFMQLYVVHEAVHPITISIR